MKTQLLTALAFLCAVITTPSISQNLSSEILVFPGPFEFNLGNPDFREGTQLVPVGIDLWEGNEVNTIYYGRTPSGSSDKPVLVFVHGYASNAQVFFTGEDNMYADVYRDGYRSVYVSLTPNDDMWTNGYMLANMITRIKSRYSNAPLVMIGWSKGGVDIDAALVHFGANNQVSEVFTLSTPHFGTGIAELANSELLSLVNIIFMQDNDATLSLQRGYMSFFRSITDGNSRNTVPYTTIGGWGNGPLNRLDIPQGILHLIDGPKSSGGNDGVVPYQSSIRPGAKELFGGLEKKWGLFGPYYDGPDETDLDHFEVTRGGKVWPFIKNELRQSTNSRQRVTSPGLQQQDQVVSSRMQWATDDEFLMISPGNLNPHLITLSKEKEPIILISEESQPTTVQADLGQEKNVLALENILPGRYRVDSKEPVFMIEESGPEMLLNIKRGVLQLDESGLLDIELTFNNLTDDQEVDIEAYLVPTVDLDMRRLEPTQLPLTVQKSEDRFTFYVGAQVEKGIYQMIVRAKGTNFKRDLMTSIAIDEVPETNKAGGINDLCLYPNPAKEMVTIQLDNTSNESELTVYTLQGQVVYQTMIAPGTRSFQWSTNDQQSGLYIVELKQNDRKTHQKLLIDN
ncbi:MAG: T9SS type A sorting domain-containing protein [Bacteroidota bacterium]